MKTIKQNLLKNYKNLDYVDMEKEFWFIVDKVQKIMLKRIGVFKDLTPEQLNILAMDIK